MSKKRCASLPDLFLSFDSSDIDGFPDSGAGKIPHLAIKALGKEGRQAPVAQSPQSKLTNEPSRIFSADERYFTDKEVAARFGVSRPTVWRWTKGNFGFPQPIQVSPGTTRWRSSDIYRFEQQLAFGNAALKQHGKRDGL